MLKFGIYQLPQLLLNSERTLFRKELKNISISLYEEISDLPNSNELAERILLLFSDVRGAYKRTYSNRFETFDDQICEILNKTYPFNDLIVHDIGVSDARTACDFFDKLSVFRSNLKYYASDYNPEITLIKYKGIHLAIEDSGKVLQITTPPFVFNAIKRDSYRHYPLNHLVRFLIEKIWIPAILKRYKAGCIQEVKTIQVFCQKAKQLAKNNGSFFLIKHNILNPSPIAEPLQMIRAMNVLNTSYFSSVEMKQAIRQIFVALADGGFFITGSNQDPDSAVQGALYQKQGERFKKMWQSGQGSSIEVQILNCDNRHCEELATKQSRVTSQ